MVSLFKLMALKVMNKPGKKIREAENPLRTEKRQCEGSGRRVLVSFFVPLVILCSASYSTAFARKLWFLQVCSADHSDPDHDPHHTDPDPRHPDQCLLCVCDST